jgi:hypothetical protein
MIPPMPLGGSSFMRMFLVVASLAAACGCSSRSDDPLTLKDDERVLLTHLTRDPYIRITDLRRDEDEHLVVSTVQGDTVARYLLAPDNPATKELKIRRLIDDFQMRVDPSDQIGTGPEPRGLKRQQ